MLLLLAFSLVLSTPVPEPVLGAWETAAAVTGGITAASLLAGGIASAVTNGRRNRGYGPGVPDQGYAGFGLPQQAPNANSDAPYVPNGNPVVVQSYPQQGYPQGQQLSVQGQQVFPQQIVQTAF